MTPPILNGRFLTRPLTGVDRFAIELMDAYVAALPAGAPAPSVMTPGAPLVSQPAFLGRCERISVGGRQGHLWEQIDLPRSADEAPLLNLCNTAPALRRQQMVVVHDAATVANPGNYSLAFRTWYRLMLGGALKRSRVVATVSAFSAGELNRHFGRALKSIEVIPESGEHILREAADTSTLQRLGLANRAFVLAVGSQSPNKNFGAVVAAMAQLGADAVPLVAVGGGNSRVFAQSSAPDSGIVRTGYVSDAQLRALYEAASCFVFPSFYEGFGLPPLEAMTCACPVIVSQCASMPEVCGDAALYCDPHAPASLAAQLRRVLGSEQLRAELKAAGAARAAEFTWARAAGVFDDILQRNFA
ncbi:MAG: glycosyltransferase family 4 protein [Cytophagales bacterium]|nr:glycosyltransferase family 4 protein [Rhizobacter sp.]